MFQMESYLIRNSDMEYNSKRHKATQGFFTFADTSKARHATKEDLKKTRKGRQEPQKGRKIH